MTVEAQAIIEGQCSGCRVEWKLVASLRNEGRGQLDYPYALVADSRGGYLVATLQRMHELLLFNARGVFQRTIGRRGHGPGEFQGISALDMGPAGTMHVFDHVTRRWTVFAPTYELMRTQSFTGLTLVP